jgi:hypothetical protein
MGWPIWLLDICSGLIRALDAFASDQATQPFCITLEIKLTEPNQIDSKQSEQNCTQ